MSFDITWNRIKKHEGEQFNTIQNLPFSYKIDGDKVIPDRTGFPLNKTEFIKALRYMPMDGPGKISKKVFGSSYVYAILHDSRIK